MSRLVPSATGGMTDMKHRIRFGRLRRDCRGGVLIEAALLLPILLLSYLGMIEITQFISTKEMLNRYANQIINISIGAADATLQTEASNAITAMLPLMVKSSQPRVSFRFCSWGTPVANIYNCTPTVAKTGTGRCGFGSTSGTVGAATTPVAPNQVQPGYRDIFLLIVECSYSPMINFLNLFPDGVTINMGVPANTGLGTPANQFIIPMRRI